MRKVAATLLLACLMLPGQTADFAGRVREGNRLMGAGRFAEAAQIYSELLKTRPGDPGLRMNLGMAYHLSARNREAVEHLEAAVKQQPGVVPALLMLGASYLALREPTRAIPHLRGAVAAAPQMKEGRQLLADALSAGGRPSEALEHYRRWTELEPLDPRAWHGLGRAYEALAQQSFRKLETAAPESAYMLALVADAQLSRRQYRSAFHLYREALKRQPGLAAAQSGLAEVYRQTGHPDWAVQVEAKSLQAAPAATAPGAPAALYVEVKKYNKLAAEAFSRLASLPASVESYALQATVLRERGLYGDSISRWHEALKLAPGNPALEKELAVTLRLNEDHAAARPLVEKLLGRDPSSPELNYLMGQILLNQQDPGAAVRHLTVTVRGEPGFLPAHSSLGLAYVQLNREAEAIPHLKAALPIDRDGSLHFRLARSYQKLGKAELAKPLLSKYQELQSAGSPSMPEATDITAP